MTNVHPRRAYGRIPMAFTSIVSVITRCMLKSERSQRLAKKVVVMKRTNKTNMTNMTNMKNMKHDKYASPRDAVGILESGPIVVIRMYGSTSILKLAIQDARGSKSHHRPCTALHFPNTAGNHICCHQSPLPTAMTSPTTLSIQSTASPLPLVYNFKK